MASVTQSKTALIIATINYGLTVLYILFLSTLYCFLLFVYDLILNYKLYNETKDHKIIKQSNQNSDKKYNSQSALTAFGSGSKLDRNYKKTDNVATFEIDMIDLELDLSESSISNSPTNIIEKGIYNSYYIYYWNKSVLVIAMDNVGKQNAEMYINSRITSQGRQETYTCDTINDDEDDLKPRRRMKFGAPMKFTRQTACNNYDLDEEEPANFSQNGDEDPFAKALEEDAQNAVANASVANASVANASEDDKLLATFNKSIRQQATFASPYSSPQKLGLMRGVSSQQEEDDE